MADRKGSIRRGGTFAKRSAASSKISKKIGWLNSHAGLAAEIRYSEVKDLLVKIGDDEAFHILKNLESKGAEIQNPTGYILNSAKNSLDGKGSRRPKGRGKGRRDGRRPRRKDADDDAANEAGDDLEARDEGEAEDVGMDAEEEDAAAAEEGDAVMEEGEEGEQKKAPARRQRRDNSDLRTKVEQRIQWLNDKAGLNQELNAGEVMDDLVGIGQRHAMDMLKQLEEKADEIRDPTAYIATALKQKQRGAGKDSRSGGKARGKGEAKPRGKKVVKTGLKASASRRSSAREEGGDRDMEKVRKRIAWLNDKAGLNDKLNFDKVGPQLLKSGPVGEVFKILKSLEESAGEVRNPNGWVLQAANRLAEEGIAPEPKGNKEKGDSKEDWLDQPLNEQLRAHIYWMNAEVGLKSPIDFDQVAPLLLRLETAEAGEILKRLEENAREVRDPTAYVTKAAERSAGGGKGGGKGGSKGGHRRDDAPEAAPRGGGGSVEEEKLRKRINWLNEHLRFQKPLEFDKVAPDLLKQGYHYALEALNTLEEHADTVRDPNAYVVATVRKVAPEGSSGGSGSGSGRSGRGGKGGGSRSSTPALPPPPAPPPPPGPREGRRDDRSGGSEEKLRKRVEWLSRNVCKGEPLDFSRVASALLQLQTQQAFDLLKNFEENADSVRDPTAYVISAARRASQGGRSIGSVGGRERERDRDRDHDGGRSRAPPPPVPAPRASSRSAPPSGSHSEPIGSFSNSGRGDRDGKGRGHRDGAGHSDRHGGDDNRVRKRINWLNDKAGLQARLDADRVTPQLMRVGDREAMEILKRLEESASTVRDPTGYVISATRREMDGKGGKRGKGRGKD